MNTSFRSRSIQKFGTRACLFMNLITIGYLVRPTMKRSIATKVTKQTRLLILTKQGPAIRRGSTLFLSIQLRENHISFGL